MKKIIFICIYSISFFGFSQIKDLESQVINLYNKQDWQGVIKLAKSAQIHQSSNYIIDYKLAEAYYFDRNYFDSAIEWEKLIGKYQTKNDVILEYLYYSYLFSGRQQDALLLAKNFPFHLQQKTTVKKNEFIDFLSAEGGLKLSSKKEVGIENLNYFNVGLGQQFGYRFKLRHAYTNTSQNYIDFNYTQNQYYANMNFQLAKGLTLISAFHYINTSEKNQSSHGNNNSGLTEVKSQLFHLGFKKQWNRFSISPNFIYSSSNSNVSGSYNNLQYGLHMGSSLKATHDKLWIGAGGDIINNELDNDFVLTLKAFYSINPKAYIYLKYLNANATNFAVENAMYYFNSVSTLVDLFSATFGYNFSPKFSWYINYQRENNRDLEYNFTFNYNTIITGIKFDFKY